MRDRNALVAFAGPLLLLAGAGALLLLSLRPWYAIDLDAIPVGGTFARTYAQQAGFATTANAWEPWGLGSDLLLFAVTGGGILLGIYGLTLGQRRLEAAAAGLVLGIVATGLVLLHVLGEPQPRAIVTVRPAAWLAVLATLAMIAGGALWWDRALHGDRDDR